MSAIAEFRLLEKSKLEDLRQASNIEVKRGLFSKKVIDNFYKFLDSNSRKVTNFDDSGYVFGNLFVFLQEQKGIDLLNGEYDEIVNEICSKRGISMFVFTKTHKDNYANLLDSTKLSIEELIKFNVEFSEDNDPEFAKSELKGILALRESLNSISEDKDVVILTIG